MSSSDDILKGVRRKPASVVNAGDIDAALSSLMGGGSGAGPRKASAAPARARSPAAPAASKAATTGNFYSMASAAADSENNSFDDAFGSEDGRASGGDNQSDWDDSDEAIMQGPGARAAAVTSATKSKSNAMDDLVVHGRASSGSVAAAVAADSRPGTSRGLTVAAAHETPSKPSLADDSWGESAEDESAPPTPPAAAPLTSTPAGRAPVARVQRSEVRANTGSQVTSTGGQVTSTGGQVHAVRPSTGSGGRPGTSSGSGTRQRALPPDDDDDLLSLLDDTPKPNKTKTVSLSANPADSAAAAPGRRNTPLARTASAGTAQQATAEAYRPSSGIGRRTVSFGDTSLPGEKAAVRTTATRPALGARRSGSDRVSDHVHTATEQSPLPSAAAAVTSGRRASPAVIHQPAATETSRHSTALATSAVAAAPVSTLSPAALGLNMSASVNATTSASRRVQADLDAALTRVRELEAAKQALEMRVTAAEARASAAESKASAAEAREAEQTRALADARAQVQRATGEARSMSAGRQEELTRLRQEAVTFELRLRTELDAAAHRQRAALADVEDRLRRERDEAAADRDRELAAQRSAHQRALLAAQEQQQVVLAAREEQHARELQHVRDEQARQAAAAADNTANARAIRELLAQLQESASDVATRQGAVAEESAAQKSLACETLQRREAAVATAEAGLEAQRRELFQERTQVQTLLAKLESEMRQQRTQLEQRAWQHSQAEVRLAAQLEALEAERTQLAEQQSEERADLQQQREALLTERRATAADLQAQRHALATERAELKALRRTLEQRERRQGSYFAEKAAELDETSAQLHRESTELQERTLAFKARQDAAASTKRKLQREREQLKADADQLEALAEELNSKSVWVAQQHAEASALFAHAQEARSTAEALGFALADERNELLELESSIAERGQALTAQRLQLAALRGGTGPRHADTLSGIDDDPETTAHEARMLSLSRKKEGLWQRILAAEEGNDATSPYTKSALQHSHNPGLSQVQADLTRWENELTADGH